MSDTIAKVIQAVLVVVILGALGLVWSQVQSVRTHVEEVPAIKQWVGYVDPISNTTSPADRIAALEASLSTTSQELLEAQVLLEQLFGRVIGEATRQIPDNLGPSTDVALFINLTGDASRFTNEQELTVTNVVRQLSQTIPVLGAYRFEQGYADAEIILTIEASRLLGWELNAMRMDVAVERVAD